MKAVSRKLLLARSEKLMRKSSAWMFSVTTACLAAAAMLNGCQSVAGSKLATKESPWENSLGMRFVPVPGTAVFFSIWDTRVKDFEAFMQATGHDATQGALMLTADEWKQSWKSPGFAQTGEHPVCCVSWEDAKAFCKWLTEKEQSEGRLKAGQQYRLPTDVEWSMAVGLTMERGSMPWQKNGKITGVYPWGYRWPPPAGAGNYAGEETRTTRSSSDWAVIEGYRDAYPYTSPVGSFKANRHGLYDMGGNVWQWCEDFHCAQTAEYRVLRGASFSTIDRGEIYSSVRGGSHPNERHSIFGFRCVLTDGGVSASP